MIYRYCKILWAVSPKFNSNITVWMRHFHAEITNGSWFLHCLNTTTLIDQAWGSKMGVESTLMHFLTHWGLDKMDATSQTTFSSAFSWMQMFDFWLKLHWSLFPRIQLTIFHHWFRWLLGAGQATSHYLNQWWFSLPAHVYVAQPRWVKAI